MNKSKMGSGARRRRKRSPLLLLFRVVAWVIVLGVLWCGYLLWLINDVKRPLPQSLPKADVIILLGAALWNDKPSPGLKERLDYAYSLYKLGKTDKLILTGGLDGNGSTITEAEGMRRYLTARGIPNSKLLIENKATSTYENLLFSKQMTDRDGMKQVLIVTHDYHSSRAAEIARYVGFHKPIMAPFKSKVLNIKYNQSREVLAYTKWKADAIALRFGWKLKVPEIAYFNH